MNAVVVRPRWARLVGAVWLATGAIMALVAVLVAVDQRRLGWEWLAAGAAGAIGWWCWHRHLALDVHGIEQCVGWRRTRLLWGVVDHVRVPDRASAPVRVGLTGRGEVALQAGWGLNVSQRAVLAEAVSQAPASLLGDAQLQFGDAGVVDGQDAPG